MKSIVFIFILISVLGAVSPVQAKLLSYGGEEIHKILDLPDEERFQSNDGQFVDVGYIHKTVYVFFLPLWNYDGRVVGVTDEPGAYLTFPDGVLEQIVVEEAGLVMPSPPYLDFWQRIGGKLVFLTLLLVGGGFLALQTHRRASFYSASPTVLGRLTDILQNSQNFQFVEPELLLEPAESKPIPLVKFGIKKYFNSLITVSLIDMKQVDAATVEAGSDEWFEQLNRCKQKLKVKGSAITHYLYLVFETSPSQETLNELMTLRKRKLTKSANLSTVVIDGDSQTVHCKQWIWPSKKTLAKSFVQGVSVASNS